MLKCRLVVDVGSDFHSLNFAPFRLPYETCCCSFPLQQSFQLSFVFYRETGNVEEFHDLSSAHLGIGKNAHDKCTTA